MAAKDLELLVDERQSLFLNLVYSGNFAPVLNAFLNTLTLVTFFHPPFYSHLRLFFTSPTPFLMSMGS